MTTATDDRPTAANSLYEHVGGQLERLVELHELDSISPLITRSYELLCSDSLGMPCGRRPPRASHLNADGTPFQFSLTVGRERPPLQFLTEIGTPGARTEHQLAACRRRLADLAGLFASQASLPHLSAVLADMAPDDDPDLLGEEGGAVWLGAGFSHKRGPQLKLYVNAKWGTETGRWARIERFAGHAGIGPAWAAIQATLGDALQPLGVAAAVGSDGRLGSRIYLAAFGEPAGYYERLARRHGGRTFGQYLGSYLRTVLQDDYEHPTRSAVCSFGAQDGAIGDVKVELCGHCALSSDIEARARFETWLLEAGIDPASYRKTVELLTNGTPDPELAQLHAYAGVGVRGNELYSTFYFNPAPRSA